MVTKYHARFTGRTKGAIGIFYEIRSLTDGETPEAAKLALYDEYEHIQGLTLTPLALRYVPTYVNRDGLRTLMAAAQGRNTYETEADAQSWLDAVFTNAHNSPETLRSIWGDDPRCEVRPCWCWPGHFDPVGIYFHDLPTTDQDRRNEEHRKQTAAERVRRG